MSKIHNESQRQLMLSFAYMAYCGELITTDSPQNQILGYLNAAMPQIPPLATPNALWNIVWGPSVYTVPGGKYQDNLMYVAQNQTDKSQYAIAIRGTNFISGINWLMDDFDVLQTMTWPPPSSGVITNPAPGALISEGASIGLQTLLSLTPHQSTQNIIQFLEQATQAANVPLNICVTGHSLGGMLATTFALYLYEARTQWDQTGNSNISCISFAGPTSGNQAFATYSDEIFAAMTPPLNWDASLGTNCDAVRCSLDIAPLMFDASNISNNGTSNVLAIYVPTDTNGIPKPGIDFNNLHIKNGIEANVLNDLLEYVAPLLIQQNYTQVVASAQQLAGQFQPPNPALKYGHLFWDSGTFPEYLDAFAVESAYQHSDSYPNLLGVTSLLCETIIQRS